MRKNIIFVMILFIAILITGCDSDVFIRINTPPIIIEPTPTVVVKPSPSVVVRPRRPIYRYQVDGYFSYDYRNHHIVYTKNRNNARYYEPLSNAKITITETGQEVRTDKNGYFYARGVPKGRLTIKLVHSWVGQWDGEYFTVYSW